MAPRFSLKIHHKLVVQMAFWFAMMSMIPLSLATYLNFAYAAKTLDKTVSVNLYGIAQRQSSEIKSFIENIEKNTALLTQIPDIIESSMIVKNISESADPEQRINIAELLTQYLSTQHRFLEKLSFNNLFLISPDGSLAFSVHHGSLFETGTFKDHAFYTVIDNTLMSMSPQISDFINDPLTHERTLLFTAPILHKNIFIGIIATQIKAQDIFKIINNYIGLGKTGESIIGQQQENTVTILNPTRHFKNNDSIKNIIDPSLQYAVDGQHGFGTSSDYRNKPILGAWEYLPKLRWGLVVKKDLSEILEPIIKLKNISLSVGSITLLIAIITAFLATQKITRPILSLSRVASRIAQGDLTAQYTTKIPNNEIGILANAIAIMSDNLKQLIDKVKNSSDHILSIYSATSYASKTQSEAAIQTASASEKISQLAQSMSLTAQDLLNTIETIHQVIQKTALQAEFSRNRLRIIEFTIQEIISAKEAIWSQFNTIQEKANSIHSIFNSITKIADRTNILSLNTAIEAHQMGKSALGFRVVAREIKLLYDQTASSSLQIEKKIQEMDQAVRAGVISMQQFSEKVAEESQEITTTSAYLNNLIEAVAQLPDQIQQAFKRMQSQLENAEKIDTFIRRMHLSVHSTASVLNETSQNLESLRQNSHTFQKEIARFKT